MKKITESPTKCTICPQLREDERKEEEKKDTQIKWKNMNKMRDLKIVNSKRMESSYEVGAIVNL